jgi:hypothetical protein
MPRLFALAVLAITLAGTPQIAPAAVSSFSAILTGPAESPPNASLGIGSALVTFDSILHELDIHATWSGLTGTTTIAHIHTPTAIPLVGIASVVVTPGTLTGFPAGVTSGTYDHTFDTLSASTYPAAYVTLHGSVAGAEAALITQMSEGRAYFNIHSSAFGGGEIRGFLLPIAAIPEPSTYMLMLAGLGFVGFIARRRYRLLGRA